MFSDLLTSPADTFVGSDEDPWGGDDGGGAVDTPPPSTPSDGGKRAECEVCGRDIPLTPTGRIPRVKLCEDHRGQAPMRTKATTGTTRKSSTMDKRLQAVVDDLQKGAGELAGTLVPVAPVTAAQIVLTGPDAIDAIVRIASDHPKMLEGLEAAAKAVPFMTVGKFIAGLILAVSVDMGQWQPRGIVAEYLRVAEAADKVGWTPPQPKQPKPTNGTTPDGARVVAPPTFTL